jgi:hypothetical protein
MSAMITPLRIRTHVPAAAVSCSATSHLPCDRIHPEAPRRLQKSRVGAEPNRYARQATELANVCQER